MSVRIYALAREHNIPSKDVMDMCAQLGVDAKSHMSAIAEEDAARVLQAIKNRTARPMSSGVTSAHPVAAPPVATAIRREDYVPPSGVSAKVPTLERPARPAEPAENPPAAPAGKSKTRPLPKITAAGRPTMRPVPPPKQEAPDEAPKAQKPQMRLSGVLKTRPATPTGPAAPTSPTTAPPAPLRGTPRAPLPAKPPAGAKPVAAEKRGMKPAAPAEEEERPHPSHRPGAVAGREERQKKRGRRAIERRQTPEEEALQVLAPEEEAVSAAPRPVRARRRMGVQQTVTTVRPSHIVVESPVSVRSFSQATGIKQNDIQRKLISMNVMATINSTLEDETAQMLAIELGVDLEIKKPANAEDQIFADLPEDQPEDLKPRPPVVTFLGHVDHGKTSLLDALRKSNVVASEAGGITQHIGAYQVQHHDKRVTLLDTPGHQAFTAMRARGAHVTDVVVLVVAADDGAMPQTEEAINHARAAEVPIVVAVNKIDLPNANPQRVMQQLSSLGVLPAAWGGDTEFVETSATTGRGLDKLIETLALVAELRDLKANPDKHAVGTCLEAALHEGRGVLATFLVQQGTLHRGDLVLCGQAYGRVKAMFDDHDRPIQEAGPATPLTVSGLDDVPPAGERFLVTDDLAKARQIAEERRRRQRAEDLAETGHVKLENWLERMTDEKVKELRLIIRADVQGSIEAIKKELGKLEHKEVSLRILHSSVGAITESDVILADASDAVIIGFHVVPDERARALAEEKGVEIRRYEIIYQLTDDIRKSLEGMLKPELREIELGRALVQQVFKLSRVGTVAGCRVLQGTVERVGKVRLIRDGRVIYPEPGSNKEVSIQSLKRVKEDVREVREGFECGIKIAGYDDLKEGDVIECYRIQEMQRTL